MRDKFTNPSSNKKTKNSALRLMKSFFLALWKGIRRNWARKLIAFLIALLLWGGLISQNKSLLRPKTFENVPINVSMLYSDTFKNSGYIVTTDLINQKPFANVLVNVPVSEYNEMTLEKLDVRIINTAITEVGTHIFKISATAKNGTVVQCTPNTISVEVDRYLERAIPVDIDLRGEIPHDDIYSPTSLTQRDPSFVKVSGPEMIISKVRRVHVPVELSTTPHQFGDIVNTWPFKLQSYDNLKKAYVNLPDDEMKFVEVRYDDYEKNKVINISVTQKLFYKKNVNVNPNIKVLKGVAREGYEVIDISIDNDSIIVYGDQIAVEQFNEVSVNVDNLIDINDSFSELKGPYKAVTGQIPIVNSSTNIYLEPSSLNVSYIVKPIIEKKIFTESFKIEVRGLQNPYKSIFIIEDEDSRNATSELSLTGPKIWLDKLRPAKISLYTDLSDLEPGIHEVKVFMDIEGSEDIEYSYELAKTTVKVRIEK